ncbi:ABC transporter [Croceicoccus ponticola]|uniref:ABC transporter n=1 Tax=Croceicoccus ponticola TaxID=2217664 RepID=A0A437GWH8_9SPHN|nr:ABC-type transport auxiliary lipoprotein family protein [Croceicoccus ponticola]RVQ66483.1 ABC transporter [Croceicoccus ponticola]
MFLRPKLLTLATPLAMALVLGGCVSIGGGGKPPEQLITFTPREVAPPGTASAGDVNDAIVVIEPEVDDRLDVNRVPVQVDPTGVAYLADATYVDRPARLFQHLVAETMRARTGGLVIEGEDPGVPVQTRLYGRLIEVGYNAQGSSVTVMYDAVAVAPNGTMRQRRFGATVTGIAPTAAAVAPALNDAANTVAGEVATWLTGKAG